MMNIKERRPLWQGLGIILKLLQHRNTLFYFCLTCMLTLVVLRQFATGGRVPAHSLEYFASVRILSVAGNVAFSVLSLLAFAMFLYTVISTKKLLMVTQASWCGLCFLLFLGTFFDAFYKPSSLSEAREACLVTDRDACANVDGRPINLAVFAFVAVEPMITRRVVTYSAMLIHGPEEGIAAVSHPWYKRQAMVSGCLWVLPRILWRLLPTTASLHIVAAWFLLWHAARASVMMKSVSYHVIHPTRLVSLIGACAYGLRVVGDVLEVLYLAGLGTVPFVALEASLLFFLLSSSVTHHVLSTYASTVGGENALLKAERDAARTQLEATKQEMSARQAAEAGRQRFMRYVFHEVRVPFNSIIMGLEVLADEEVERLSTDGQVVLDMLGKSASAAKTLLNDVLDFSKIENGAFQISLVPARLKDLVHVTSLSMMAMARDPDIRVELCTDVDPSLPELLLADKVRLQQVVANLISNAIKFSPHDGTGKVNVSVRVIPESVLHFDAVGDRLFVDKAQDAAFVGEALVDSLQETQETLTQLHWRESVRRFSRDSAAGSISYAASGPTSPRHSSVRANAVEQAASGAMQTPEKGKLGNRNFDADSPGLLTSPAVGSAGASAHLAASQVHAKSPMAADLGTTTNGWPVRAAVLAAKSAVAVAVTRARAAYGQSRRAAVQPAAEPMSLGRSSAHTEDTEDPEPSRLSTLDHSVTEGGCSLLLSHDPASSFLSTPNVTLCSERTFERSVVLPLPQLGTPAVDTGIQDILQDSPVNPGYSTVSAPAGTCACMQCHNRISHCTLLITVKDNGSGIPRKDLPILFSAFRQLDAGLQYKGKGTGLGLAICHEIISLHGGRVGVASTGVPGEGATFAVLLRLPVLVSNNTQQPSMQPLPHAGVAQLVGDEFDTVAAAISPPERMPSRLRSSSVLYCHSSVAPTPNQQDIRREEDRRDSVRRTLTEREHAKALVLEQSTGDDCIIPVRHGYHGLNEQLYISTPATLAGRSSSLGARSGSQEWGIAGDGKHKNSQLERWHEASALSASASGVCMSPLPDAVTASSASVGSALTSTTTGPRLVRKRSVRWAEKARPIRVLCVDDIFDNRRLLMRTLAARLKEQGRELLSSGATLRGCVTGDTLSLDTAEVDQAEDGHIAVAKVLGLDASVVELECRSNGGTFELTGQSVNMDLVNKYDVITMDAEMPTLSGFAATRLLRLAGYQGMILGCTGNGLQSDHQLFRDNGCDEVFVKPISAREVAESIVKRLAVPAEMSP